MPNFDIFYIEIWSWAEVHQLDHCQQHKLAKMGKIKDKIGKFPAKMTKRLNRPAKLANTLVTTDNGPANNRRHRHL